MNDRCFFILSFLFVSTTILLSKEPSEDSIHIIPHLRAKEVKIAVMEAVEVFNGFRSKEGQTSLLDLRLQKNTIAGILHNLIGEEVGKRASYWRFIQTGATGGDLIGKKGESLELKTSSSLDVKGNQVSRNNRYYLVTHFILRPDKDELVVVWIRGGRLEPNDWRRPKGTQWAFLNKQGESKLKTYWKDFGELSPSHLKHIGKKREQRLFQEGIFSIRQMATCKPEQLGEILRMSEQKVVGIIAQAKERIDKDSHAETQRNNVKGL